MQRCVEPMRAVRVSERRSLESLRVLQHRWLARPVCAARATPGPEQLNNWLSALAEEFNLFLLLEGCVGLDRRRCATLIAGSLV